MKKIIFSLVALFAFSFSSMANDISEVKEKSEVHKIELNTQESLFLVKGISNDLCKIEDALRENVFPIKVLRVQDTPCYHLYVQIYVYLVEMGFTYSQANSLAMSVHSNCIKETYGPKEPAKIE